MVVLLGSEARGEARPDSGIDALAALATLTYDCGHEPERELVTINPIALRLGRRGSVKPPARAGCELGDNPVLCEVRRSAVAA